MQQYGHHVNIQTVTKSFIFLFSSCFIRKRKCFRKPHQLRNFRRREKTQFQL